MTELISMATGNRPVQHLPVGSLRRFGIAENGSNLYRVVFSTSRLQMLGGKWPDGAVEYRWSPRYPTPLPMWVLEKWLSAMDYAGPESQWQKDPETNLFTLGPYPKDGEYEYCFGWPLDMEPSITQVEAVIQYLEYKKLNFSEGDHLRALEDDVAKKQRNWMENNEYIMRDAIRTKAMRPTPSNPEGKTLTANDMKFNITADQLPRHMPRQGDKVAVTQGDTDA